MSDDTPGPAAPPPSPKPKPRARPKAARSLQSERKPKVQADTRPRRTCFSAGMRAEAVDEKRRKKGRKPVMSGRMPSYGAPGPKKVFAHMLFRAGTIATVLTGFIEGMVSAVRQNWKAFVPAIEGSVPRPSPMARSFQQEVRDRMQAAPVLSSGPGSMEGLRAIMASKPAIDHAARARISTEYGRPDFVEIVFQHVAEKRDISGTVQAHPAIRKRSPELADWLEFPARDQFKRAHAAYRELVEKGGFSPEAAGEEMLPKLILAGGRLQRERAERDLKFRLATADDYDPATTEGPRLRPTVTNDNQTDAANAYQPPSPKKR